MNVSNNFGSIDNKRILWDLLLKNNIFSNIPISKEKMTKSIFENNILTTVTFCENSSMSMALSDYNKHFISSIIPELNKMKTKKNVSFQDNNLGDSITSAGTLEDLKDNNVLTAEKQKQIREDAFSASLENKQNEFTTMIQSNTPKKIDFSDSAEDQHITDMDRRIESMISSRDSDIKTLFKDTPPPSNMVKPNIKPAIMQPAINQSNIKQDITKNKKLSIGNPVRINDIILLTDPIDQNDERARLSGMLEEILSNQKTILERLETIKII